MTRYLDVLGRSFTVPDPDSVASLSASFRTVCINIGDAQHQLSALGSPQAWGEWTGQAADAFGRSVGVLPHQLGQAWQSYNTVACALADYAGELSPVVAALGTLAFQAEEAEGTLRATVAAREQAIHQGQDPAATGWNSRLQDAEAAIKAIEDRLSSLLGQTGELSAECVALIRQAQHEGIQNNAITDFQRYVLQDAADPYVHAELAGLRFGRTVLDDLFVKPFVSLDRDIRKFHEDPSFETLGVALEDLGAVLAIVAILVPGLGEFVAPVLLAAVVSESVAEVTHESGASWGQVGMAALSFGLVGTGAVLGRGVDADSGYMSDAFDERDLDQMQGLADGTDARVSASALWNTGLRRFIGLPDATSDVPETAEQSESLISTLKSDDYSFLHFGEDGFTHSPAAVTFQHVQFGLDRAGDAITVLQDQSEKGQPE
jgi:hypothetical protein